MQTITLRCDDSVAGHIYALLSNTKGVEIEKLTRLETKKGAKNSFLEFAGLWKDRDVTLDALRDKAWKR